MNISCFDARVVRFELSLEEEIVNILAPGPQIKKYMDTLHSQTLKVEEKKVALVFFI